MEGGRVSLMDNAVTASPSIKENDTAAVWPTCSNPVFMDLKGSWGLRTLEWERPANEISSTEQRRLAKRKTSYLLYSTS